MTGSIDRVRQAAIAVGLDIDILVMPGSTRTAQEAAAACGCGLSQIVKSLVFANADGGDLFLLLISGDRRVDVKRASAVIGATLERADVQAIRERTGFAIGGVSPIGHVDPLPVFMDENLLTHERVWAAAGAPNAVFGVDPRVLKDAVRARVLSSDATSR